MTLMAILTGANIVLFCLFARERDGLGMAMAAMGAAFCALG